MKHRTRVGLMALTALIGGCSHVTNQPMCSAAPCHYEPRSEQTYRFTPRSDKETLVVVTLSGGGSRAAALAFGVLQTLGTLDPAHDDRDSSSQNLLDQVDILSSVSGGSITAAWYALKGSAGLDRGPGEDGRLWAFLNQEWTAALAWKGLNPVALGRYALTSYERNDVLADFFADKLFGEAHYADVLQAYKNKPHQPYVILNATDLGHEAIFSFTQGRFDLLCSDLTRYRLANAVAASANFPLAFSPLGLQNYSGCAAQRDRTWNDDGPPQWLQYYDRFDVREGAAIHSYQLNEIRSARLAQDYIRSAEHGNQDQFVHLLDGGVTDNLGIRATLAIEDDPARVPSLYLRLGGLYRPAGYEHIRRVLYIVVNARTHDPGWLDKHKAPPGEIATALRMVDTQLDASTLTDQDYLIAELESISRRQQSTPPELSPMTDSCNPDLSSTEATSAPFLSCKPTAQAHLPRPDGALRFYVVAVDFEMIPDKACRDRAWLLPTNFGLKPKQTQAVTELGRDILGRSVDLARFYDETNSKHRPELLQSPPSLDHACALLAEQ